MTAAARATGGRVSAAAAVVIVCAAACVPYLSTLDNYFVADDFGVVQLLASKPWSYFPQWFVSTWMDGIWGFTPDEVRPFPALSYQLTALGPDSSPLLHHVFNIAMHAATAVLVMRLARDVAKLGDGTSTFAGGVFAVLPVQAESVAWITGRVDSMPAFFYIACFLLYVRWREAEDGSRRTYVWSLVLFGIALFTKQNAISMAGTLVAYDVLMLGLWRKPLSIARAVVPFAVMTMAYLYLRYVLFGEVAREGRLSAQELRVFAVTVGHHLNHVVFGSLTPRSTVIWGVFIAGLVALGAAALRAERGGTRFRALLFFGPVWWAIGVAPILVAGYESPRHVYLASAGWAIVLAMVLDLAMADDSPRQVRQAVPTVAVIVVSLYAVGLQRAVREWNAIAAVSKTAVADLEREVLGTPPGALFIVDAPIRSWEWALPFAAQPPFASEDLTRRAAIVSPMRLHCCRGQWFADTRATLEGWMARGPGAPVVALRWTLRGDAMRLTDASDPSVRAYLPMLLELKTPEALNSALVGIAARAIPATRGSE